MTVLWACAISTSPWRMPASSMPRSMNHVPKMTMYSGAMLLPTECGLKSMVGGMWSLPRFSRGKEAFLASVPAPRAMLRMEFLISRARSAGTGCPVFWMCSCVALEKMFFTALYPPALRPAEIC